MNGTPDRGGTVGLDHGLDADVDLDAARATAVHIAEAAGRLLRQRHPATLVVRDKGPTGDVVTDLDEDAERLIIGQLRAAYPGHRILAEESGLTEGNGHGHRWTWLVDPLDGTNNIARGLQDYAVGLALCDRGVPMVGVVHDPVARASWAAVRGRGAWGPGIGHPPARRRSATLGWTQGYAVSREDVTARALRFVLEANAQRLLQLWAPLLCWAMLARGDLDGIVGYRPETIDLPAGVLIAREAGMEIRRFDGRTFDDTVGDTGADHDRSFVAGPRGTVDWLVALVREGRDLEPPLSRLPLGKVPGWAPADGSGGNGHGTRGRRSTYSL